MYQNGSQESNSVLKSTKHTICYQKITSLRKCEDNGMYDAVMIESGPAGYTAAIYCIRAWLLTLIIEGMEYGGQLMNTVDIENYPGFIDAVNGFDLMTNMRS